MDSKHQSAEFGAINQWIGLVAKLFVFGGLFQRAFDCCEETLPTVGMLGKSPAGNWGAWCPPRVCDGSSRRRRPSAWEL